MFIPFPSIESFRKVVADVRKNVDYHGNPYPYPVIEYVGRPKLHGTNAGIRFKDGQLYPQSRSRTIDNMSDNAGFAAWVKANEKQLMALMTPLTESNDFTVYGEWIGPGIQKNVAINEIPEKSFVVFAYRDNEKNSDVLLDFPKFVWKEPVEDPNFETLVEYPNIFHIDIAPHKNLTIDFGNPEAAVEALETATMEYENECPFGKKFGVSGIGEGLVWSLAPTHLRDENSHRFTFKTKGEKHGNKSAKNAEKPKVAVSAERIEDFNKLLDTLLPDWRLEQGYKALKDEAELAGVELSRGDTGEFIKWVNKDILKEDDDIVAASGFEWKVIAAAVANRARQFFFNKH